MVVLKVKNLPGNGNPLQYSCLGSCMDRGAWWATIHGVAKSWTQLSTHNYLDERYSIYRAHTHKSHSIFLLSLVSFLGQITVTMLDAETE